MAKGKNEILLSIALEGDADVKAKLKAVGEVGKQSMADIERQIGAAQKHFDGFGSKPLSGLKEALAPLTEASGLAGNLGGLGSLGGLLSRLGAGLLSPAGLVAGITTALLGMAKLGDETQRQKGRLNGFGDAGGFDQLTERAKKLGTSVSDLQPRYEKFLASQQKASAENRSVIHPPGFEPGPAEEAAARVQVVGAGANNTPPSRKTFGAFDSALLNQVRRDVKDAEEAKAIVGQFEDGLAQGGLSGDLVRSLQQSSPHAANFIKDSLGPRLGRGFANPNELATLLDRGGAQVSAPDLINAGAKAAPEADKAAAAARGVTQSFEALTAATGRLVEKFSGDHASLGKGIDAAAKLVDQTADKADSIIKGPDRSGAPNSLKEVYTSDKGDLIGRAVNYALSGENAKTNGFGGGNPFGVIIDFLKKAVADPGSLKEKDRSGKGDKAADAQIKAASDHSKAAAELSEAAKDLSTAAEVGKARSAAGGEAPSGPPTAPVGGELPSDQPKAPAEWRYLDPPTSVRTVPKLNEDGSVNPYGGLPTDRTDGYSHPFGKAADNEAQRRQTIIESAKLSAEEYRLQRQFNQNIRDQNGGNSPSTDTATYALPTFGHYDPRTQAFVARPTQPPRDPNAVAGAPRALTWPTYQRAKIKEFQDKFGPTGNPPGVENPGIPKGLWVPGIIPDGDPYGRDAPEKGVGSGDTPLKRIYIGPDPSNAGELVKPQSLLDGVDGNAMRDLAYSLKDELKKKDDETATFADGGTVKRFPGGGGVSGPGTSTSDSIPAMLSDGEYVIRAQAARKIGRSRLDFLNAGNFADGGGADKDGNAGQQASRAAAVLERIKKEKERFDNWVVKGGARVVGDPVRTVASEDKSPGASDFGGSAFVGDFDWQKWQLYATDYNKADGGPIGRFAGGGAIGALDLGRSVSFPGFAIGGPATMDEAPSAPSIADLGGAGAPGGVLGHYKIDLGIPGHGDVSVMADEMVAKKLSNVARDSSNFQTGTAPSWAHG